MLFAFILFSFLASYFMMGVKIARLQYLSAYREYVGLAASWVERQKIAKINRKANDAHNCTTADGKYCENDYCNFRKYNSLYCSYSFCHGCDEEYYDSGYSSHACNVKPTAPTAFNYLVFAWGPIVVINGASTSYRATKTGAGIVVNKTKGLITPDVKIADPIKIYEGEKKLEIGV